MAKSPLRRALVRPPVSRLWHRFLKEGVTIFLLHRFHDDHPRHDSESVTGLRETLESLRRDGYRILSLGAVVDQLLEGAPFPVPTVVFTIDDGYRDFLRLGADAFMDYDCPATVFLATGFLDGDLWLWWDQVDWILQAAPHQTVDWPLGSGGPVDLGPRGDRIEVAERLWADCKRVTDPMKHAAIGSLAEQCGLELPSTPPPDFEPLTWDEVRSLEARGFDFGPHTVTHPILSQLDDDAAESEIHDSWSRVKAELDAPVPIFAYPNGQVGDFGEREMKALAACGLKAAVTTEQSYAAPLRAPRDSLERFRIPRFDYPGEVSATLRITSGLEDLVRRVR